MIDAKVGLARLRRSGPDVPQPPVREASLRWITLGALAVLAVAGAPVLAVLAPPLADYLNHLARIHILATIGDSDALARVYAVDWKLAPYVLLDILGLGLATLVPILWVGRILVLLVMALFLLGALLLHRALFGRASAWPLLAGLFLYNHCLYLGFLPYLLSAGLACLGCAVWVLGERWATWQRIAAGSIVALLVFLSHYYGVVALGLCFAGYDAARWWQEGCGAKAFRTRLLAVAAPFVLPLVLSVAISDGTHTGIATRYDAWPVHLSGLVSSSLYPGSRFDMAIQAFCVAALAAGLTTRRILVAPAIWPPVMALMVATLVLPGAPVGLWGMQFRLPVVAATLLAASFRPVRPGWPEALAALLAAMLFVGHVGTIAATWLPRDAQYRELRAALPLIPEGSRLLPFTTYHGLDPAIPRGPYYTWANMPALAVIDRDVFYPNLHKQPMQAVQASELTRPISPHEASLITERDLWDGLAVARSRRATAGGPLMYWADWPRHFDVALGLHFGAEPPLPPALQLMHRGSFFSLYRIARPDGVQ